MLPDKPIESYEEYVQRMSALSENTKLPISIKRLIEQFKFRILRINGQQDLLNNDLKEVLNFNLNINFLAF